MGELLGFIKSYGPKGGSSILREDIAPVEHNIVNDNYLYKYICFNFAYPSMHILSHASINCICLMFHAR